MPTFEELLRDLYSEFQPYRPIPVAAESAQAVQADMPVAPQNAMAARFAAPRIAPSNGGPEMTSYEPRWQDRAAMVIRGALGYGDERMPPEVERVVSGLTGSTGV